MKCRMIDGNKIIWFGSKGKDTEDNAIFAKPDHSSYSSDAEAVKDSVTERLSILKGELWYSIRYGVPLFDKIKSKSVIDASVVRIVTSNKDVNAIQQFESSIKGHNYSCSMTIQTVYGKLKVTI